MWSISSTTRRSSESTTASRVILPGLGSAVRLAARLEPLRRFVIRAFCSLVSDSSSKLGWSERERPAFGSAFLISLKFRSPTFRRKSNLDEDEQKTAKKAATRFLRVNKLFRLKAVLPNLAG